MVIKIYLSVLLLFVTGSHGWRAIPANQAMYSARKQLVVEEVTNVMYEDSLLPRTSIHSTYKFGWCAPGSSIRQYLRKSAVVAFPTWESAQATYVYLIEPKNTIRYRLQCVLLRIMVPRKYLFRRSRLPLYYCQGYAYYVMFNFVQRIDMHEFYLHHSLNMPADFHIEFYHPKEI